MKDKKKIKETIDNAFALFFVIIGSGASFWTIILTGISPTKAIHLFLLFFVPGSIIIGIGTLVTLLMKRVATK